MKTTKPISTISFNSENYLHDRLEDLLQSKIIQFYCFIKHKGEDDEGGKKDHCHVYLEPSKLLQTEDLKEEFREFVSPDVKPLGCLSFVNSKFDDWYLYGLHDKAYLASKNQSRKYHYTEDEMLRSDDDEFLFRVRQVDVLEITPWRLLSQAIDDGLTFEEFLKRGSTPIQQINAFEKAWYLLQSEKTYRNGRPGHANDVDESTGEVLSSRSDKK